jgi:hypothetical protein
LPRIKKWFMLWMWRVQQVSQPLTLTLMAINLSLTVFGLIKWREGSPLSVSWIGVPLILLLLAFVILSFALIWDLRLKMWRDQATVLVERNPYSKEKMSAKEIMIYGVLWLPVLDDIGKRDPKAKIAAEALREWIRKASKEEPVMEKDLDDVFKYIGVGRKELMDFEKKN